MRNEDKVQLQGSGKEKFRNIHNPREKTVTIKGISSSPRRSALYFGKRCSAPNRSTPMKK